MIRLLAMTWTVRLVLGMAGLAPVMVRLAPPGMYGKPGTGDGKPGTRDGEPEPGSRDQGVPGTADGSCFVIVFFGIGITSPAFNGFVFYSLEKKFWQNISFRLE